MTRISRSVASAALLLGIVAGCAAPPAGSLAPPRSAPLPVAGSPSAAPTSPSVTSATDAAASHREAREFVRPFAYAIPAGLDVQATAPGSEVVILAHDLRSVVAVWAVRGGTNTTSEPCRPGGYVPVPGETDDLIAWLEDLDAVSVEAAGETTISGFPAAMLDVTGDSGCARPLLWRASLRGGEAELRAREGEPIRLIVLDVHGMTVAVAASAESLEAWLATAQRIIDSIEFREVEPPLHCSTATDYQIAYRIAGMDEVEVTCDLAYKRIAGLDATLDLYLPPGTRPADRLPAVIFVHGNDSIPEQLPLLEHWKTIEYERGRIAAASGLAAVAFDYRGYRDPATLAEAQQDVIDLVAHVAAHADELRIDPDRICLWATSGGGYPAAWAAIQATPRPRCVVVFSAGLDADWAPERNPTERVAPGMPPVFIARGRLDHYSVPTRFVERAEAAGIEVVLREHPGAHGFENTSDPEQQAIVAEALAFVLEHLRARTP